MNGKHDLEQHSEMSDHYASNGAEPMEDEEVLSNTPKADVAEHLGSSNRTSSDKACLQPLLQLYSLHTTDLNAPVFEVMSENLHTVVDLENQSHRPH